MIASNNRFHGRKAVSKVRAKPLHSSNFSVRVQVSRKSQYRVAVVVSKKVDNRAVVRNKIRRRVFEFYRLLLKEGQPLDVVVYAKGPSTAKLNYQEISKELKGLQSRFTP